MDGKVKVLLIGTNIKQKPRRHHIQRQWWQIPQVWTISQQSLYDRTRFEDSSGTCNRHYLSFLLDGLLFPACCLFIILKSNHLCLEYAGIIPSQSISSLKTPSFSCGEVVLASMRGILHIHWQVFESFKLFQCIDSPLHTMGRHLGTIKFELASSYW